jgi:PBP1b-binding outer membrane lipoprotein LpoB
MRALILALCSAVLLSGCISSLDAAYDEQSRTQCEQETNARNRGDCLDRVDRQRQRRD